MRAYRRIYLDGGKLVAGDEDVFGEAPDETTHPSPGTSGLETTTMGSTDYDFGADDDLGAMDYPSLGNEGDDDFGDDDGDETGAMDYPSLGASRRRFRRRGHQRNLPPRGRPMPRRSQMVVQKTILTGRLTGTSATVAAGQQTITIRPQFDFVAEDVTFDGSTAAKAGGAWTILAIRFGDRIIFNNTTGIPITTFAVASFIRGLVKGAAIAAGLDIQINANLSLATATTASTFQATFIGLKRGSSGCGPGAV